jgi:hypothetical protein
MPLQNRVDPWGRLIRTAARGSLMGNRGGAIHNPAREIVRQYNGRRWITCVLEFKGRSRKVMSPGLYTELFFLDEAVAFAAGHRPCAECRRSSFRAFVHAWRLSHHQPPDHTIRATEIDAELHSARIVRRTGKITYQAPLVSLPDGSFVDIDGAAYLVWGDALYKWSPEGYVSRESREDRAAVTVLTPAPIVECFRAGYMPRPNLTLLSPPSTPGE